MATTTMKTMISGAARSWKNAVVGRRTFFLRRGDDVVVGALFVQNTREGLSSSSCSCSSSPFSSLSSDETNDENDARTRERWMTAYAVAVRDAFSAKTARAEEEPSFRAVMEVKQALEKEAKETKTSSSSSKSNSFALSSLACRAVLTAELSFAQNEDEVTRVLNLSKRLADSRAASTHIARSLAMEALRAGVPASAIEKSSVGKKLMPPPTTTTTPTRPTTTKEEEEKTDENDILWSMTFPSEKILSSAGEIQNEMHRKGYVILDGVLGEVNSKICEEAAWKFYDGDLGKAKFKSGELAYEEKNAASLSSSSSMPPQKDSKYRDDEVTWLSGDERGALGALSQFLRDTLGSLFFELFAARDGSNKHLLLRPEDYHSNAMLSVYSSDRGGFVKHLDHDNASDPRKISAVYYLNSDWDDKENGGALLLYPSGAEREGKKDEEVVRVNPIRDRLVLFWSDKMYHAVEPVESSAKKNRLACSFWYL
jgi:hypothetical protein